MLTSVAICPVCVSIFLYANDILLIALSVSSLQTLINICETELLNIDSLLIQISLPASDLVHNLMLILNIVQL